MKKIKIKINNKGNVVINGIKIKQKIFDQEKSDYKLIEREEQIDFLIELVSQNVNENYKEILKSDLKELIKLKDKYIYSSINTNEYIAYSDNPTMFYDISKNLLELNGFSSKNAENLLLNKNNERTI